MNLTKIIIVNLFFLFLYSCADYKGNQKLQNDEKIHYSSSGFALIYEENLYKQKIISKKIDNKNLKVMHSFLKKNTPIKIINPDNSKVLETKIYKKAKYPQIFHIVINKKIASLLELDVNNPYVEIIELRKNKTFIAGESKMFEEEKNVANKAPVDEITVDNLKKDELITKKKLVRKNNFILVIADFYYINSANDLKNELVEKININNISVKKINDNKYRLLVGPFKNFNALKNTYISLNNLGFAGLNIYRE